MILLVVWVRVTSHVVRVTNVSSVVTCSEVVGTVSGAVVIDGTVEEGAELVVVVRVLGSSEVVDVKVLGTSVVDVVEGMLCETVLLVYGGKVVKVLEVVGALVELQVVEVLEDWQLVHVEIV